MNAEPEQPAHTGDLPAKALVIMAAIAAAITLGGMLGLTALRAAAPVLLTDALMALMVLLSAAGYGHAICRFLVPQKVPAGLLLATSAAVGLWVLGTAVFIVGSAIGGALTMAVWWPVLGAGVALALVQAHRPLGRMRLPARVPGDALVWVIVAAAASVWLAGALMPPGWLGNLNEPVGDATAVLGRHMQLPREYYLAGRVRPLSHNVYSHFPPGMEMLELLGMCLRGGPYEGMYLGKLTGALFVIVAVVGAAGGLRDDRFRARAATALLATAPWVAFLAGLALPELACLCYVTLALLWLRTWLCAPRWRPAACAGAMIGGALACSYAAAITVAAPVIVVMFICSARGARRALHAALAGAIAVAMAAPVLVRNAAATGNPVFPLATRSLGQGHWTDSSARRWRQAHGGRREQADTSSRQVAPQSPSRRDRLTAFFLEPRLVRRLAGAAGLADHTILGTGVLLVLAGTLVGMFLRPRGPTGWDWALLGVAAMQLAAWLVVAPRAPARFAAVAVAAISLLCAGGLARLADVREVAWLRQTSGVGGRWGLAPAALLLIASAALSLRSAAAYWRADMGGSAIAPAGLSGELLAREAPEFRAANATAGKGRLLIIGDGRAFYFPARSRYATAFDELPLAAAFRGSSSGDELAAMLRNAGITHVYVAWARVEALRVRVDWPQELSPQRLQRLLGDWPVADEFSRRPATAPATSSAPTASHPRSPATATAPSRAAAPIFTLYAVPAPTTAPGGDVPATAPAPQGRSSAPTPAGSPTRREDESPRGSP